MNKSYKTAVVIFSIGVCLGIGFAFQNCAKAKYYDPDPKHTLIALGVCRECTDSNGNGLACKENTNSTFGSCKYESCLPGFKLDGNFCVAVGCNPGDIANCMTPNGEGRMTCKASGIGYTNCSAINCVTGYTLINGSCVALGRAGTDMNPIPIPVPITTVVATPSLNPTVLPLAEVTPTILPTESPTLTDLSAIPTPTFASLPIPTVTASPIPSVAIANLCGVGSHRDCSTSSTYGYELCNSDGMTYAICVFTDCKPGFYKNDGQICVPFACDPQQVTPCTIGDGVGLQTCNSQGSAWGSCVINGCQQGYILKDGVCVIQTCSPGATAACDFNNGSGIKTCNPDGLDYGACQLLDCQTGYTLNQGQCQEQICSPGTTTTCQGEGGTGIKYCNDNGLGYKNCKLTQCDESFRFKNGICIAEKSCAAGKTSACSVQNGTGLRTCENKGQDHQFSACIPNQCTNGYDIVNHDSVYACQTKLKVEHTYDNSTTEESQHTNGK